MGQFERPYFMAVGALLTLAGALSLFMGFTGGEIQVGALAISGPYSIWRGAVLLPAGFFFLSGTNGGITDREDEALIFMGSVMIWIVGGTEVLGILLAAIPGSPDVWLASVPTFLAGVSPPYPPSVLAILLTLPAYRYAADDFRTMLHRLFGSR